MKVRNQEQLALMLKSDFKVRATVLSKYSGKEEIKSSRVIINNITKNAFSGEYLFHVEHENGDIDKVIFSELFDIEA